MSDPESQGDQTEIAVTDRAIAAIGALRSSLQRYGLLAALLLFIGGSIYALGALDLDLDRGDWLTLALVAIVGVPPMILLNAAEIQLAARMSGDYQVDGITAGKVAVTGTAANLLPIPGATLVRIDALNALGVPAGAALRSNVAVGGIWVLASAIVTAALLVGLSSAGAWAAAATAAVVLAILTVLLWKRGNVGTLSRVLAVESMALLLTGTRLWAISTALGEPISMRQAVVIAASYALTSAVGVLPGGLGLREALASGLAVVVGLPGAVGFLASAVDRALGFAVHAPIVAALAATNREPGPGTTSR